MPEPSPARLTEGLHELARVLRDAPPLGQDAQQALAALIDELGNVANSNELPPAEVTHLAETTAHFVKALEQRHESAGLAAARDRLEGAFLSAEAKAPVLAGLARRALDALANLGI